MPSTVCENVAFDADSSGSDDAVWQALERVGLSAFVSALPRGIQTQIGEKAAGLSGGQKQLVCLARALFRQPDVLLLDEPTAALDRHSEQIVLTAIKRLPVGTTIVMVSHKLENFRDFDVIYACEHGRLNLFEPWPQEVLVH